jgi:hypothetical protein
LSAVTKGRHAEFGLRNLLAGYGGMSVEEI